MNEQKQHKWSKEEFAKMMNEKRQSLFKTIFINIIIRCFR